MIHEIISGGLMLLNVIEKDAGIIVGPIASVMGFIINFIFQLAHSLFGANSLGLSIIVLTIIIRTLMLPVAFKQQKSTLAMQKIQPEVEKINKKYGDSKDPELMRKKNAEIQALYSKSGVNLLGGCLPLLFTLPIFFALTYLMRSTYLYIPFIGDIYNNIAETIHQIPDYVDVIMPIAKPMVPNGMVIDFRTVPDMVKLIAKFTPDNWNAIMAAAPDTIKTALDGVLAEKQAVESFMGISLVSTPGFSFPGVLIPALSGITQFLTFWMMEKMNPPSESAKSSQAVMKFMMPAIMVYFTGTVAAGVGLYWTTSNVYQLGQQFLMNKYYKPKEKNKVDKDEVKPRPESKARK